MKCSSQFFKNSLVVIFLSVISNWSLSQVNLRPELARPLQQAQDALKLNQATDALRQLQEARAVANLKDDERILIERLTAVAATTAQQYSLAIPALEYLVQSKTVEAPEKLRLLEHLINVNQHVKNYPGLVKWAQQYVVSGGENSTIRLMLLQTLAVQGQHDVVIRTVQSILDKESSGGILASESELRVLAGSQNQIKDQMGYFSTLKLLIARAPSKDYWVDLVSRVPRQSGFNNRYELDVYRLLETVGGLDEADDVIYMASLALKAGLPSDAMRLIEHGYTTQLLGAGSEAGNHAKLRQQALLRLGEDEKFFGVLEKSAKNGSDWGQFAEVLASKGLWERANEAYAKALDYSDLKREAELRLHYGISLIKAQQVEAARKIFASVRGESTVMELASLWLLRIK